MTDPVPNLLVHALSEAAGAAMVLDDRLRVVAATKQAHELVGSPIEVGTAAPALLCGTGPVRPVADAMARGKPVAASVVRPSKGGEERLIHVRATPLAEGDERIGWLLLMDEEGWHAEGADAPVEPWGILTRNAAMKRLLRDIERAAASDAAVLVRGETGSGKELVARAIHDASSRSDGPFRAINCAALPESLLESALFGHVRGAFTGATSDEPGHFRLADGGTLFLDEIGELPLAVQATLLRVLQDKTVIPIGGREPIPVDVRIVTATHRALRQEVQAGRFRADLMFRVRVLPLFLPPLRDRREDIELLAWRFVEERNGRGQRHISRITEGARDAMARYDWPGNVRELRNYVERAVVLQYAGPAQRRSLVPDEPNAPTGGAVDLDLAFTEAKKLVVEDFEQRYLTALLEWSQGNVSRAARKAGMDRMYLHRLLQRHGIRRGGSIKE